MAIDYCQLATCNFFCKMPYLIVINFLRTMWARRIQSGPPTSLLLAFAYIFGAISRSGTFLSENFCIITSLVVSRVTTHFEDGVRMPHIHVNVKLTKL